MNEFDDQIRAALKADNENTLVDDSQEASLTTLIGDSFRGRWKWLTIIVWFKELLFLGIGIFAIIRFFSAETTHEIVGYAALATICVFAMAVLDLWYWMLLNRNSTTREIKRLELQVAKLNQRQAGGIDDVSEL